MRGVNKVILVGRLGNDPEVRHLESNQTVANFSLATNRVYKTKEGERKEETEWHRIVVWGRLAEIAQQYLKKGSMLFVEGRLQTRKWQDKDGHDRYTTEIRATDISMLDKKGESAEAVEPPASSGGGDDLDNGPADDLPF